MQTHKTMLALECSTDTLSVALQVGEQRWSQEHAGGAQASAVALGLLADLLNQAQLQWSDVNLLVFGRGPGAFTGVRVACAMAQGLAVAQSLPFMPISGLLAIAENARQEQISKGLLSALAPLQVLAAQDARMGQAYVAECRFDGQAWALGSESLRTYAEMQQCPAGYVCAGNLRAAMQAADLVVPSGFVETLPSAGALLQLAQQYLAQGVQPLQDPAQALPAYVRDKVAQTTAERQLAKQGA